MNDSAELLLKQAQLLSRSVDMFPILEVALLGIVLVLAHFFVTQRARNSGKPLPPLILLLVTGGMLCLTAVFAKLWGFGHALLALSYGIAIPLVLLDEVVGIAFLIVNSMIRPWEMSALAEMSFIPKTLFAICLLSWATHAVRARRLHLVMSRPCKIFYGLALWFLLSALCSGDFMEGLTKYSGNVMIAAIIFFLVTNSITDRPGLELVKRSLLFAVTALIAHAIFVTVLQPDYDPSLFRLEDAGTVGNSNDLAAVAALVLPIAFFPLLKRRSATAWVVALATIPILLAGLWISQSRGAVLALAVGGIGYLAIRARNRRVAIALVIVCLPVLIAIPTALNFARESDDLEGSANSRKAFMLAGINMGIRHPILGVGHDNFSKLWDEYAIGQTYESGQRSGHSSWLIAFAENGLPGLALLMVLFYSVFKIAIAIRPEQPELLVSQLAYGVAMTFLAHAYTIYPYLLFALIITAARILPIASPGSVDS